MRLPSLRRRAIRWKKVALARSGPVVEAEGWAGDVTAPVSSEEKELRYMTVNQMIDYMIDESAWGEAEKSKLVARRLKNIPRQEAIDEFQRLAPTGAITGIGRLNE